MQVGDFVRTVLPVRTNPVVNDSRGWEPIPPGRIGIILGVRQTELNAQHRADGEGDVYVDVELAGGFDSNGARVRLGNYHSASFEVII